MTSRAAFSTAKPRKSLLPCLDGTAKQASPSLCILLPSYLPFSPELRFAFLERSKRLDSSHRQEAPWPCPRLHFHTDAVHAVVVARLRFESAMNRDIPNTHTHSGIKISIGRAFFSRPSTPARGHGPFTVVRHSTKRRAWTGRLRRPPLVTVRYQLFYLRHRSFTPISPVFVPSPFVLSLAPTAPDFDARFNGHFSAGVTETRVNIICSTVPTSFAQNRRVHSRGDEEEIARSRQRTADVSRVVT